MLQRKIFLTLWILVMAVVAFAPTGLSVQAAPVTAAQEIGSAGALGCSISLWAPYKAGGLIKAKTTITCSTTQSQIDVVTDVYGGPNNWLRGDGAMQNTCTNTTTCSVIGSYSCDGSGYYRSDGYGQAGSTGLTAPDSPPTYITCP